MTYHKETGAVGISVAELAAFAYPRESPEKLIQKYGFAREERQENVDYGDKERVSPANAGKIMHNSHETDQVSRLDSVLREVPFAMETEYDALPVVVNGIADLVFFDGTLHTVEELKTKSYLPVSITPFDDPSCFAQVVCYAHMLAETEGLSQARIRITFLKRTTGDVVSYSAVFTASLLRSLFTILIRRAGPFLKIFAEKAEKTSNEILRSPFPFQNIREGQRDFVLETFRAIRTGGQLFVSAPTGIGKTMAALYPAVKAVGLGYADRIFYLTAKTVTGVAALEAARTLRNEIPHFYAVLLCARETLCPMRARDKKERDAETCAFCANLHEIYSADGGFLSLRERQNDALLSLLCSEDKIYTPERIKSAAEEYSVCPYELSIALSRYCELIVCDYNYAYDDSVRFRRYFKTPENREKYVFLIDEAHNLPERVRDMYSASVSSEQLEALLQSFRGAQTEIPALYEAVVNAVRLLEDVRKKCRDGEYIRTENDEEIVCGYYKSNTADEAFVKGFARLSSEIAKHIRGMGDYTAELAPYRRIFQKVAFVCSFFDERFCFFAEKDGNSVRVDLLCLDPSELIGRMNQAARSVVQFSATLSPMEYYKTVCGCPRAAELDLPSPYQKENLCLIAYDGLSARFSDRKQTASETAYVISEAISAKKGNYLVYFSSYAHMKTVFRHFSRLAQDVTVIVQKPGMSYRERRRFLSVFGDDRYSNVVGFCVLGGTFSEGIDLAGEKLIGAIIVGMGTPGLSAQRNIMMEYYDHTMEKGREFAYVYPGMNKVLQAAGRVIRSENDRGMVLLIDDRYGEPSVKALFPSHWRHLRYTGDPVSLRHILGEFWTSGDSTASPTV